MTIRRSLSGSVVAKLPGLHRRAEIAGGSAWNRESGYSDLADTLVQVPIPFLERKREILRSATPKGFAQAVFAANCDLVTDGHRKTEVEKAYSRG